MDLDRRHPRHATATALATTAATMLALVGAVGCAPRGGPPRITRGTPCVACGMGVEDLRFGCERSVGGKFRVYDSIECLLQEAGPTVATVGIYLTDYDHGTLHPADSLWIVRGNFPTPMGGGFAAFGSLAAAEEVASRTEGRVGRLAEFAVTSLGEPQ